MKFHEKLSILMYIAKTTNQELAINSSLDSSYISRLKNGNRKPVKGASYLIAFSHYLSKRLSALNQQELIKRLLGLDSALPFDQVMLADLLYHWLTNDSFAVSDLAYELFKDIPSLNKEKHRVDRGDQDSFIHSSCCVYFNTEGKRLAALDFLERIANNDDPLTLLLYSDEDMTWMTGDPNFTSQWSQLMKTILTKGNRIRIIHDLTRDLDEIFSAIRSWIPLYMTGAIEPFYYPRIRDGIYKRSLYIAPGLCVSTSSSIGSTANAPEETVTFLFTEKKTIRVLQKEFDNYLTLCRPLMNILTADGSSSYFDLLTDFEKKSGTTVIKTKHLSSISMPETVLRSFLKRNPQSNEAQLLAFQQLRTEYLERTLREYSVQEIFSIPSLDSLCQGKVMIDHSCGLEGKVVYYTKDEYRMHLKHVLHLLQYYENYHVAIEKTPYDLGYSLYAKENTGVMVIKNAPPLVVLSVAENNLAIGFWDFLMELGQKNRLSKKSAIALLERTIDALY